MRSERSQLTNLHAQHIQMQREIKATSCCAVSANRLCGVRDECKNIESTHKKHIFYDRILSAKRNKKIKNYPIFSTNIVNGERVATACKNVRYYLELSSHHSTIATTLFRAHAMTTDDVPAPAYQPYESGYTGYVFVSFSMDLPKIVEIIKYCL